MHSPAFVLRQRPPGCSAGVRYCPTNTAVPDANLRDMRQLSKCRLRFGLALVMYVQLTPLGSQAAAMAEVRAVSTRILGNTMRDAVRNQERWKRRVRLPKILVLTCADRSVRERRAELLRQGVLVGLQPAAARALILEAKAEAMAVARAEEKGCESPLEDRLAVVDVRHVHDDAALWVGLCRIWRVKQAVPKWQCGRQWRSGSATVAVGAAVGLVSARRFNTRHAR